jgi:diadenylate cyclase
VPSRRSTALDHAIASVAPGQPLREGLNRILQAGMGALIVIGDGPEVLDICSGGFVLDAAFSPQRLSEIAKMDGAVILSADLARIVRANVHLVPDPDLPTSETGTRHRTAERVAQSLHLPVISVSERMTTIAIYLGKDKYPLDPIPRVLARADQALQALERYRSRHDSVMASLAALEVQDLVTVRDVASALQRAEMVVRIANEVEGYVLELGADGRMVRLQLVELMGGVVDERRMVVRDYLPEVGSWSAHDALEVLSDLETDQLLDLDAVMSVLHLGGEADDLDEVLQARGYRMLSRIPRLSETMINRLVDRFGLLDKLLRASIEDLESVEGMGALRARTVRDGLSRLAETSILDRYS